MRSPRARGWWASRVDSYSQVVTALLLNVPVMAVALARHLEGVAFGGVTALYLLLVFVGYYALLLFLVITVVFLLTMLWRRLAMTASGALLVAALFYLVVNGIVHQVYRFHIDAFWLQYVLTSFDGMGITTPMLGMALAVLAGIALLEWGLFRLAGSLRYRGVLSTGFVVVMVAAYVASQAIHFVGYERNDSRITGITPQLPFYYPLNSHSHAVRLGELIPIVAPEGLSGAQQSTAFRYPLHDVSCLVPAGGRRPNVLLLLLESWRSDQMDSVVSPSMYALSLKSSVFLHHFSSGNATPTGVMGLFYGIHPTYWSAIKANSASIHNPVLIDALEQNGYAFGIYADSQFERHKIKDTVFQGIDVHETFAGATPDLKDADLNAQLLAFMQASRQEGRPFFGFAFYKSTHYSYCYPQSAVRFRPFRDLHIGLVGNTGDLTPFLNDYRNSVRYVDDLIGDLILEMERTGLLNETIIVITSDHGEEFNDNHANYWGHTSNFTRYQTQVPMIIYVPWEKPRQVTELTTHIDLVPTLLQEGLGCRDPVEDYSNGRNLFGPLDGARPLIMSGYVNHAIVMGDDVYSVFPMMVQKYKLGDIKAVAGPPLPDLARQALDEMHRFYGGAGMATEVRVARTPGGKADAQ